MSVSQSRKGFWAVFYVGFDDCVGCYWTSLGQFGVKIEIKIEINGTLEIEQVTYLSQLLCTLEVARSLGQEVPKSGVVTTASKLFLPLKESGTLSQRG
jgi:hypothetical protein